MNTNQNWNLLTGAALGAGVMYLLDPGLGGRRRALIRDKMVWATHKTGDALDTLARDVGNRTCGLAAKARGHYSDEPVDAATLEARVRAELGRVVSHPRAIEVSASIDGSVCLCGPILTSEADQAIAAVESVRGVCGVEDRLERHDSPEGVPSLQGGHTRPGRRSAFRQQSWSPTTKMLVGVAATALAVGLGYAAWGSAAGMEEVAH